MIIVRFQSKIKIYIKMSFGDKLDSQLYVTISSNNNQIPMAIYTNSTE